MHETGAITGERAETIDTKHERAAIAVEVQHHRLVAARRQMPHNHILAVGGFENDLLGVAQAGGGRRRARVSGKYINERCVKYMSATNPPNRTSAPSNHLSSVMLP